MRFGDVPHHGVRRFFRHGDGLLPLLVAVHASRVAAERRKDHKGPMPRFLGTSPHQSRNGLIIGAFILSLRNEKQPSDEGFFQNIRFGCVRQVGLQKLLRQRMKRILLPIVRKRQNELRRHIGYARLRFLRREDPEERIVPRNPFEHRFRIRAFHLGKLRQLDRVIAAAAAARSQNRVVMVEDNDFNRRLLILFHLDQCSSGPSPASISGILVGQVSYVLIAKLGISMTSTLGLTYFSMSFLLSVLQPTISR